MRSTVWSVVLVELSRTGRNRIFGVIICTSSIKHRSPHAASADASADAHQERVAQVADLRIEDTPQPSAFVKPKTIYFQHGDAQRR